MPPSSSRPGSTLLAILLSASLALAWLLPHSPGAPTPASAAPQADSLWVSLLARADVDLSPYFITPPYQVQAAGLQRLSGWIPSTLQVKLSAHPAVITLNALTDAPAPPESDPDSTYAPLLDLSLRGADRAAAAAQGLTAAASQAAVQPSGWYENDTQGVRQVWETYALDGAGVTLAVLDSGIDFANPALAGRYYVQPATASGSQAYVGWPVAFDARSLEAYLLDPVRPFPQNWGWFVNTAYTVTGSGEFSFPDPLTPGRTHTVPGGSLSGVYHFGYHPDTGLEGLSLLVADETTPGVYDTVYLDLDFNGLYETRLTQSQPVAALDVTADGLPDLSGGMLYWIADGTHPPPGASAIYGAGSPTPSAGALVAFMLDDVYLPGGGHGTLVASSAVGNDAGVFQPDSRLAEFYTNAYGPLVQGPAPQARLISLGNLYAGGSLEAYYWFTLTGLDGIPGSGDEAHIVNLSFNTGSLDADGWDWQSRLLTYFNAANPATSPLYIHSSGNGGYGYGTLTAPSPLTGLEVGAATQFGVYNTYGISETISLPSRVNYGDLASLSGRGPGADGIRGVDLVANGLSGSGAYPLNGSANGALAYIYWSGTSRSAPVVSGIAALAAEAYFQAHGVYPGYAQLRQLLVNAAATIHNDPLSQGAGYVNALRAVQAAFGDFGLQVSPTRLDPAQLAPAFSGGLQPAKSYAAEITLSNPAAYPQTANLSAINYVETARYSASLPTLADTATNNSRGVPDYALNLTPWVQAHPTADLLVVRLTTPYEHFDSLPPSPPGLSNLWWLMVYNWWDDNGNQLWWQDLNQDGRLDFPAEIDGQDEWLRFDYSRLRASQQEVRIQQPYQRSLAAGSAGLWAGAMHVIRAAGDNATTLNFEVIFYEEQPWTAVEFSQTSLSIPAHSQVTVPLTIHTPPAETGLLQGALQIANPGRTDLDPLFTPTVTHIPVIFQVLADADHPAQPAPDPHTLSPNGWIGGGYSWAGEAEAGDWRFSGFDNPAAPGDWLVVHTHWTDYPTDLDTLIFTPAADPFSDLLPAWFGDSAFTLTGGSLRSGVRPAWNFHTSTGTTEEWLVAPAQAGLNLFAHQAVLYGSQSAMLPYIFQPGLLHFDPQPLLLDPACPACPVDLRLSASLDLPAGLELAAGYGWSAPQHFPGDGLYTGDQAAHSLILSTSAYRLDLTLAGASPVDDLDLCLYRDDGSQSNIWDAADTRLTCAETLAESENLTLDDPAAGRYWAVVTAFAVDSPAGAAYTLTGAPFYLDTSTALSVAGLPAAIQTGETYTLSVHSTTPFALDQLGLLVFTLPGADQPIELPVHAAPLADLWVTLDLPLQVEAGESYAYSIHYGNSGPSPAAGVTLVESLPPGVSVTHPLTHTIGSLAPGAQGSLSLTASVDPGLSPGDWLNPKVAIFATSTDPRQGNDVAVGSFRIRILPQPVYLPFLRTPSGGWGP